jgi:hypothetical protein
MSDFVTIANDPAPEDLVWFFRERPALTTKEAGYLLGWPEPRVRSRLQDGGVVLPDGRVAWEEVVFWLLDAWPRRWVLETLGPAADLLPQGLHLTPIPWELPRYIVQGLTQQAALQLSVEDVAHRITVQDYIARLLHLAIVPETVTALAGDASFRDAYEYFNGDMG